MKKNIKVLYIAPTEAKYAGDNKSLLNLLSGLNNYEVTPLIITSSTESATEFIKKGFECEVLPYPFRFTALCPAYKSWREIVRFPYNLLLLIAGIFIANKALNKIVQKFNPDIIHSNTSQTIIGYNASKKNKIPHFWHIREFIDLDFNTHLIFSKKAHRKLLRKANNHLIIITECVKRHYQSPSNSRVIYDGVLKAAQTQFKEKKNKQFLFVGRLTEMKGIFLLLNAFIDFCAVNKDYELVLAGEKMNEEEFEIIKKLVHENGISSRVKFLGNRDDVFDLMASSTALIVPSLNEAFGRITVEAMYNGCLVIGNDSSGTQEILKKEVLGLLFSNQKELTSKMETVAKNGIESYFPMIKKAQERATILYSEEQNANLIFKYYQQIVSKS
ncbi:MAG: glycosyltransferase family 4 protein [Bacteroidota bacterium]